LEDPFAEELLRGNIKPGEAVEVHAEIDKLVFRAVNRNRVNQQLPLSDKPVRFEKGRRIRRPFCFWTTRSGFAPVLG
jgi:hypothetical protein